MSAYVGTPEALGAVAAGLTYGYATQRPCEHAAAIGFVFGLALYFAENVVSGSNVTSNEQHAYNALKHAAWGALASYAGCELMR